MVEQSSTTLPATGPLNPNGTRVGRLGRHARPRPQESRERQLRYPAPASGARAHAHAHAAALHTLINGPYGGQMRPLQRLYDARGLCRWHFSNAAVGAGADAPDVGAKVAMARLHLVWGCERSGVGVGEGVGLEVVRRVGRRSA